MIYLTFIEAVSGLKMNLGKGVLVPVEEVEDVGWIAQYQGVRCVPFQRPTLICRLVCVIRLDQLGVYLWKEWKGQLTSKDIYLPKGGRITLIKTTLSSLPTYCMLFYPIPLCVANFVL